MVIIVMVWLAPVRSCGSFKDANEKPIDGSQMTLFKTLASVPLHCQVSALISLCLKNAHIESACALSLCFVCFRLG